MLIKNETYRYMNMKINKVSTRGIGLNTGKLSYAQSYTHYPQKCENIKII